MTICLAKYQKQIQRYSLSAIKTNETATPSSDDTSGASCTVGLNVGRGVGLLVGLLVGLFVGLPVGLFVGLLVGLLVGFSSRVCCTIPTLNKKLFVFQFASLSARSRKTFPSTDMVYPPLPFSQHIPSPPESVMRNTYLYPFSTQICSEYEEFGAYS